MPRPARASRVASVGLLALVGVLSVCLGLTAGPASAGQTPTDGLHTWNFHQIRLTAPVQNAGHGGSGVVVAVVDTWVDGSHPELRGRVLTGADCVGGSCHAPTSSSHDQCGHGTHVSGTVAGKEWGVAPRATILPVRVLTYDQSTSECTGSTGDVAAGINWATAHGADVINLSLAPEDADTQANHGVVTVAVQNAVAHGVVVVFAAGNNDRPVGDNYGGRALIVAATGPSGSLAAYSQHGQGVSVAAPGGQPRASDCASDGSDCVISAWLHNGYAALAGTSMAAPHVSGLAALLLSQTPGISSNTVVDRITGTARPLSGAGSGRVDAASALGVNPTPTTSPTAKSTPTQRASAASKSPSSPTAKPTSPAPITTTAPPVKVQPDPPADGRAAPTINDPNRGIPTGLLAGAFALLAGVAAGLFSATRARAPRG